MSNEIVVKQENFDVALAEVEVLQRTCAALMKTKHYAKMGEEGIFAIIQKAKSIGLSPLDALNGGMYFTQGKVELSANSMNFLIRAAGHSITKDPKSDQTVCILNGRRKDNGDTWTTSFSINDAKRAGIYKNTFEKYPEDLLFARALTRLARQLFPDVIRGCYVEGECRDMTDNPRSYGNAEVVEPVSEQIEQKTVQKPVELIDMDEWKELEELLVSDQAYRQTVLEGLKKNFQIDAFNKIPKILFPKVLARVKYQLSQKEPVTEEKVDVQTGEVTDAV